MTPGVIPSVAAKLPNSSPAGPARPARAGRIVLAAIALATLAARSEPAAGQDGAAQIVGRPTVVDGDSLNFAGRLVHLWGVDAPERPQTCRAEAGAWPCGEEARWALLNRVSPHWVTCVERGLAPDGGTLARCYLAGVGQQEVNAWLVAEGWALADRSVSDAYAAEETAAQAAGKGLWRGAFDAPWDWRRDMGLAP